VTLWQEDAMSGNTLRAKTMGQLPRGLLSALVGIDIEGEKDSAGTIAQLSKLVGVQMCSQRASDVVKARLP